MNDKKDDIKQTKLTLGGTKLTLKSTGNIHGQNFATTKSNTVVEIKKTHSNIRQTPNIPNQTSDNKSQIDDDFCRRLALIKNKKASEAANLTENKTIFTKLAFVNKRNSELIAKTEDLAFHCDDAVTSHSNETINLDEIKSTNEEQVLTTSDNNKEKITPIIEEILLQKQTQDTVTNEDLDKKPIVTLTKEETKPIKELVAEKSSDVKAIPKVKTEESKKLKKTDILHLLDADENDFPERMKSIASIKRAKEKRKLLKQKQEKIYREVIIPETIAVSDLANRMSERVADVIRELMKLGIMANMSHVIDADIAEIIVTTLGHSFKRVQESDIENILLEENDSSDDLKPRSPVVSIMGHVDHGKTSLLDALKSTDIVATEVGGITQHIGAYVVHMKDGRSITFIDTPGHEAFSEMRMRGAKITDIVVLVVAADDGVKTQTIEAINHAKAAKVPIIVAINKIDKADIDINKIKHELLQYDLIAEEFGGDVMMVGISALKKLNLDKLEETILLLAEMEQLTSNPTAAASGVIIEAKIDKNQGVIATALVQRGTLRTGDILVAGHTYGKIRKMRDERTHDVLNAGPSMPVEIYGLNTAPRAGESFNVVKYEKQARDIAEYRTRLHKDKQSIKTTTNIENMFSKAAGKSLTKDLTIIIKGDVQGSIEAIVQSLNKLPNSEIHIRILHQAVGAISESDTMLAATTNSIILGFNVRPNNAAGLIADRENIDIRYYSIIYNLIDDVKLIMSGMLAPIIREHYIGSAEIRQIFNISKVGKIAGTYVTNGIIKKGAGVRLLRDNIVIHEGKLKTLKRFKEEVKEVRENFECGVAFEKYEDIREGDVLEAFEIIEEKRQIL
jgi:translation initiation factor IF-2